jgi:hypothetical protein
MSRMRPYRRRQASAGVLTRCKTPEDAMDEARCPPPVAVPRALDGTLRPLFGRWYPGLANDTVASNVQVGAA